METSRRYFPRGISFRWLARCVVSLPMAWNRGKVWIRDFPPILSRCSPLHGALSRCLALCAYSVSFRGSSWRTPNQSLRERRISRQSPIRSGAWAWVGMTSATHLSCMTEGQDSGQDRAGQPATSNNQLSAHRPPPHPSHPHPSPSAGTATGKIPCVERFL